ncbi:MAG: AmmeMemoRadiSam system protein A [Candidatus Dadabacteria bacterium]|nr:MAG: AmmeMemoRadiSam system protein A [Candidatus Dadabacteria bacterium]
MAHFTEEEKKILLKTAKDSVEHGVKKGKPLKVKCSSYPTSLQEDGASFVTIKKEGELRGCVGSVVAHRPLIQDVAENAFAAAFKDSRFLPVSKEELPLLSYSISVLTPLKQLKVSSEEELIEKITPGKDGIILIEGPFQGTFLPVMWERLPNPKDFLAHLKIKAGLHPAYWSDTIQVYTFQAEKIGEDCE